jgi:hypothetical protein
LTAAVRFRATRSPWAPLVVLALVLIVVFVARAF